MENLKSVLFWKFLLLWKLFLYVIILFLRLHLNIYQFCFKNFIDCIFNVTCLNNSKFIYLLLLTYKLCLNTFIYIKVKFLNFLKNHNKNVKKLVWNIIKTKNFLITHKNKKCRKHFGKTLSFFISHRIFISAFKVVAHLCGWQRKTDFFQSTFSISYFYGVFKKSFVFNF